MKFYSFVIYFILGIPILINSFKDIFLLGITCDGIYSGLYFLYKYFNKELTENQIISSVGDIYIIDTITRYQYYFILNMLYYLINIILFYKELYLYYILYILLLPSTINYIYIKTEKGKIFFNFIITKRNLFFKKFFSKQISKLIENNSFITGSPPLVLSYNKIMPLWSHIDNISEVIISMIKNILIITIINHLKINMNNISYNFIKKLYNYKSGEEVSTKLNLEEAQKNIRLMIMNNDWKSITSARITNSLKIIYINYDTQNISILKKLEFKLIIFFSYWSIGNFISLYFIPPIHALIEIYRYKSLVPNKIINCLLSLLITITYNNSILTSFITAFGYPLLINNLTISFLNNLFKKKYIFINIHFINISKLFYILKYTSWILINNYISSDNIYKNYIKEYDYLNLKNYMDNVNNINNIGSLFIINIINAPIHKILFLTLYISNIINNHNLLNLFINLYLCFILSNLYDIIKGKMNNNIINDSIIKKEDNNKYEIKIDNNKYEIKINNNKNEDNMKINNDYQFKYFLEESMIIIN
jgi:hypothetical protein